MPGSLLEELYAWATWGMPIRLDEHGHVVPVDGPIEQAIGGAMRGAVLGAGAPPAEESSVAARIGNALGQLLPYANPLVAYTGPAAQARDVAIYTYRGDYMGAITAMTSGPAGRVARGVRALMEAEPPRPGTGPILDFERDAAGN